MKYISIANACCVRVEGANQSYAIKVLEEEFTHHISAADGGLPIVGIIDYEDSLVLPKAATMLLDNKLFVAEDDIFVCEGCSVIRIRLTEETFQITAGKMADEYALPVLLQALLNYYLPLYDRVFLHAASFSYADKVYALHGFGGAGKSEVMVSALLKGATYLSDDLVVYDTKGNLYPYLRKIGLHDYDFSDAQIETLQLNRRLYHFKCLVQKRSDRLSRFLYRKLRGRFNIAVDYKVLQINDNYPPLQAYSVARNFWLDASDHTGRSETSRSTIVRKIQFCMLNEFRQYVDFDGYFGLVYPFWETRRRQHADTIEKTLQHLSIETFTLKSKDYDTLAELIIHSDENS